MASDLQRLRTAGFTDEQARAIIDAIEHASHDLVTRDYLHEEFQRFKRSILLWVLAMQAPVYAALIYMLLRMGS